MYVCVCVCLCVSVWCVSVVIVCVVYVCGWCVCVCVCEQQLTRYKTVYHAVRTEFLFTELFILQQKPIKRFFSK